MSETDLFIQWGVAGVVALGLAARRQLSLFHPTTVYLAFHVVVFCLRPTFVYYFDFDTIWNYLRIVPQPAKMQHALLLSSAGLIVFCVSFSLFARGAQRLEFLERPEVTSEERRAFAATALIFVPLGLYSLYAARPQMERVGDVVVNVGSSGYVNDLQQVFIPLSILFILVCRWRWWSYLPYAGFVYFRATQGWGRWTMLLSFFLLVLVWLWDHRRKFPPVKFAAIAVFLLFVFINMSHNRSFVQQWISGGQTSYVLDEERTFKERWDTSDFANFDFLTFVVSVVPDQTGTYTYGTQYLQLFTEPIPRAIWKTKPAGMPVRFFDLNDYGNFFGMTPSLVGDGWMSGGWVGALLTMAITGGILGRLYVWFTRNHQQVHRACAFLIVNAMIVQLFRDGGISIFKFLLFTLAPLFVWSRFSEHYRRVAEMAHAEDEEEDWDEAQEDSAEAGDEDDDDVDADAQDDYDAEEDEAIDDSDFDYEDESELEPDEDGYEVEEDGEDDRSDDDPGAPTRSARPHRPGDPA